VCLYPLRMRRLRLSTLRPVLRDLCLFARKKSPRLSGGGYRLVSHVAVGNGRQDLPYRAEGAPSLPRLPKVAGHFFTLCWRLVMRGRHTSTKSPELDCESARRRRSAVARDARLIRQRLSFMRWSRASRPSQIALGEIWSAGGCHCQMASVAHGAHSNVRTGG
jgi:hypothetical protein